MSALDEYLSALRSGGQDLQAANQSVIQANQMQQMRSLGQQLPSLAQQPGGVNQIAGQLLGAGDPGGAIKLLTENMGALNSQQIQTLNPEFSPQQSSVLGGMNAKTQEKGMAFTSAGINQRQNRSQHALDSANREDKITADRLGKVSDSVSGIIKPFNEKIDQLQQAIRMATDPTISDQRPVDRILVRSITTGIEGASKRVPQQEMDQLLSKTGYKSWSDFTNFVKGDNFTALTPDVRNGMLKIIQVGLEGMTAQKGQRVAERLNTLVPANSKWAYDEDGNLHTAIKAIQADNGLDLQKGKFSVHGMGAGLGTTTKTVREPLDESGAETSAQNYVDKIQDPQTKAYAQQKIQEFAKAKKSLPKQFVEDLKQAAGQQ